jgi:hypothetical protein
MICRAYLDETGPTIEGQMDVLDFTKVGELIMNVIFLRLLVHAGGDDNVALDGWRKLKCEYNDRCEP